MVHMAQALIDNGFDPGQVRRHRVFTRAAVIAKAANAATTMMVSWPLEDEDFYSVHIYQCAPRAIGNELPIHREVGSHRPRHWYQLKEIVKNFLNS